MPSLSDHKLELAIELLEDIELARLPADKLLLKATRLARLIGDSERMAWLGFELYGYNGHDETSLKYMGWTGRWTNFEERKGYWMGLAAIEGHMDALRTKLETLRLPDIASEFVIIALREVRQDAQGTANAIGRMAEIRARVLALMHRFATDRYYELAFGSRQEAIFETARARIDALLAPTAGKALQQVDSIYERLQQEDPEAISQALSTCRRLIDGIADVIFPPREEPVVIEGNEVKLTEQHHQNRINAFIREHSDSSSRRARLRRRLADLYDRVSTGVHADVSAEEARFLFLDTYLFLGEVLSLQDSREEPGRADGLPPLPETT